MLSLLNVIFRDIQNILTPVLMIILIASPFAYTPNLVPDEPAPFLLLNPFAYFVVAYQQIIVLGRCRASTMQSCWWSSRIVPFLVGSWFFATAKRVIIDYV